MRGPTSYLGLTACDKLGRRLEGWEARLLFRRRGHLPPLRLVFFAIPMFYLSVFKLPVGVGKWLESLLWRFL